jgi:hypothetical protein
MRDTTSMSQRMFLTHDDAANAEGHSRSLADERFVKEWQPPCLSQAIFGARRARPLREAPQPSGTRESPVSSVPSASLGNQVDKLLYACWLPGRWVQRVWILADLPLRLEQRARALSPDAIWRAYTDGVRLWFAIAAAADSASYGPSAVALEVLFFENDGVLCSGGIWTCDSNGHWRLENLVDMSAQTRCDWDARSARVH